MILQRMDVKERMQMRVYLDNCCLNRPFDYTKWRKQLWPGETVEQISREAMKYRRTSRGRKPKSAAQARSSGVRVKPRR